MFTFAYSNPFYSLMARLDLTKLKCHANTIQHLEVVWSESEIFNHLPWYVCSSMFSGAV